MRDRTPPSFEAAPSLDPDAASPAPPRAYLPALLALAAVFAVIAIAAVPFTVSMPDYWTDAQQFFHTGRIQQHFTPSGYPAELTLGMKLLSQRPILGVELLQALLQIAIVAAAWRLLLALGASTAVAFAGALTLALHPELLVSIAKVWDVGLSTLLLLLLLVVASTILRRGVTPARAALLGALWAFGIFDRPNYLALLPALLYAFARAAPRISSGGTPHSASQAALGPCRTTRALTAAAVLFAVTAATYSTLSLTVYRTLLFPGNGPYNLYAGQNSFSERSLLEHLNAELAVAPALLQARMPEASANPHDLALRPYLTHASIAFAATHPVIEVRLAAIKLFTLLRPDTKLHPIGTAIGDMELAMILPVPVWLVALAFARLRRLSWTAADTLIALVAVLYILPFLLTNSDPRFRMPLDALAIVHTAALLSRERSPRINSPRRAPALAGSAHAH